jgi:hypothetical protein
VLGLVKQVVGFSWAVLLQATSIAFQNRSGSLGREILVSQRVQDTYSIESVPIFLGGVSDINCQPKFTQSSSIRYIRMFSTRSNPDGLRNSAPARLLRSQLRNNLLPRALQFSDNLWSQYREVEQVELQAAPPPKRGRPRMLPGEVSIEQGERGASRGRKGRGRARGRGVVSIELGIPPEPCKLIFITSFL